MTPDNSVSPLSLWEGEGADWGMLGSSADLKVLCRIHNRHHTFRLVYDPRQLGQSPLPPGEG